MSGHTFAKKYFCAVNSGKGFMSFYNDLIRKAERIFIIKGGPGTGKSRFMHEVASAAERCGKTVDYYYCSSDSSSLDAIMTDGKTLFLDGTFPHSVDTAAPGVRDNIIDLGSFWDVAALIGQRKRIADLNRKKSSCFCRAYGYLSAAAEAATVADSITESFVISEKLRRAAARELSAIPDGEGFAVSKVALSSFGMNGSVTLDTFERVAARYVGIADFKGTAHIFTQELLTLAEKKRLKVTVAVDPLIPERTEAILIEGHGLAFEIGGHGEKCINMKRFIDPVACRICRNEYKLADTLRGALTDAALASLQAASTYHFALEKIYGEAMDFAAKEEYTNNFISELFG